MIVIPDILVKVANVSAKEFHIEKNSGTAERAIKNLVKQESQLEEHLFHGNGKLKEHFIISINGKVASVYDEISDDDKVELILAAAGG